MRRGRLIAAGGICAVLLAVPVLLHADQGTGTPTDSGALASAPRGTVTNWNSKAHCITPALPNATLTQSALNSVTAVTGVSYNCVNTFANPSSSWGAWEQPWMLASPSYGYRSWLAASNTHQVILGLDLIPTAASNTNPLKWEQPCANGAYNGYAAQFARNLVSYGAGNIVIRLGPEGNGIWETDYIGSTSTEMTDWAKCYANEVDAMRSGANSHFLFVWSPNVCTAGNLLGDWYPGDRYVSIIGADTYDVDCGSKKNVAQEGWWAFYTSSSSWNSGSLWFPSLANIEKFAIAHGKPMSFPEWGIDSGTDDSAFVTDMANMFQSDTFSYESYFDDGDAGTAPLGSATPNSTAAYRNAFK
jgi:beta-mannanase